MSGQTYARSESEQNSLPQPRHRRLNTGISNAQALTRSQAIQSLQNWLLIQYSRISTSSVLTQARDATAILSFVEQAWGDFQNQGALPALPERLNISTDDEQCSVALPLELTGEIRSFIQLAEPSNTSGSVDWNSRLGIPEYRTQSDNLAAPEATCNTTTLAMVLERLGYSRGDIIVAMEKRFEIADGDSDQKAQIWEQKARAYIDSIMTDSAVYRRIRGKSFVSKTARAGLAQEFRAQAQFEDLLDLLLQDMKISRYGVISNPTKILEELSGENAPDTEIIWNSNWSSLSGKTKNCLEKGGAAALSFRHKGTRGRASHIVSILNVKDNGFEIDDPYGDIREDYNPRKWDDAYWSRDRNGDLVSSRDELQNEAGEFGDWGVDWMSDLPSQQEKGKETFLSSTQISRGFKYLQLFHRTNKEE